MFGNGCSNKTYRDTKTTFQKDYFPYMTQFKHYSVWIFFFALFFVPSSALPFFKDLSVCVNLSPQQHNNAAY